ALGDEAVGRRARLPAAPGEPAEDHGVGALRHVGEVEVPLEVVEGDLGLDQLPSPRVGPGPPGRQVGIALEMVDVAADRPETLEQQERRGVLPEARDGHPLVPEPDRVYWHEQPQPARAFALAVLQEQRLAHADDDTFPRHGTATLPEASA